MFKKILIANRGEIACRVIKTAQRMGIQTVAVYSEADRDGLAVRMADEAIAIGASEAALSYLDMDKIIAACKQTGADAVHPGYGFLSERAEFCQRLEKEDIAFIGPNPRAIEAMGDKIESKKFALEAGVNTVPGFPGVIENAEHAAEIADGIGYPVMIKASAGGGGKGMRIAYSHDEVHDGFERAQSEAASSFGDDRIFIEKFIENPRHIEIQIMGDKHGNVVYLGERECSIQRRNQKVVEEAPSPLVDEATRKAMGEQAVALAKAVDYDSAGTVEFVAGQDKSFYFLEMNTRLQVEHPVTEMITGLDLVELMIRSAAGENLPLKQQDVTLNGWAVESRIYAEDPFRNFLPSIGRLTYYRPPQEGDYLANGLPGKSADGYQLRNDTGVEEGSEISIYYDPMIAKLVTWGNNRADAVNGMSQALDNFIIGGINHNIPFLSALMAHPRWQEGALSTGFIAEEYAQGFVPPKADKQALLDFAAIAAMMELLNTSRRDCQLAPQSRLKLPESFIVFIDGLPTEISFSDQGIGETGELKLEGKREQQDFSIISGWKPGDRLWHGTINGQVRHVQYILERGGKMLGWHGMRINYQILPAHIADLQNLMPEKSEADSSKMLLCPMPGLVLSLNVSEGQEVEAGETLAIVEAMKMENILRAERSGTVGKIHAKEGDSLAVDALIMEFA